MSTINTITPNQLYAREPKLTYGIGHHDICNVWTDYLRHFYEVGDDNQYNDSDQIHIKEYARVWFDDRRYWLLSSIWFNICDDPNLYHFIPVMITRNAGREGRDVSHRFVTNFPAYLRMINHIKTLILNDTDTFEDNDIVDPSTPIHNLLHFGNNSLDDLLEQKNR
jgi:hypothetical protein